MKMNYLFLALALLGSKAFALDYSNETLYDVELPAGLAHAVEDAKMRGIEVSEPSCLDFGKNAKCLNSTYQGLSASLSDKEMRRFQIMPDRKMDVVGVLSGNVFFKADSSDKIDFEVFENADEAVFVFDQAADDEHSKWLKSLHRDR